MSIPERVASLRQAYGNFPYRKPDPTVKRPDLERGWLAWYLFEVDRLTWQRWDYWYHLQIEGKLPDAPIPQIEFLQQPDPRVWKLWGHIFDQVEHGWQGWSARENITYVLDWMLYGFGYHGVDLPREPRGCEGASDRLYQALDIGPMMLWPYDYFGDLFAEMQIGKSQGFYPTPQSVVDLLVRMLNTNTERDTRLESAHEPAVGTGRMLLYLSNYHLSLSGQDISEMAVKACLVNGYLYAPWMVKPIPWVKPRADDPPPGIKLTQGALF